MVYLQFKYSIQDNSLILYKANTAYITQAFNPSNNLDYYYQTFTTYGDLHDVRGVGPNPTNRYGVKNLVFTYTFHPRALITDSVGGIVASINNFTDADAHFTGLTFDGLTNYVDLSSNSINVGGDETIMDLVIQNRSF